MISLILNQLSKYFPNFANRLYCKYLKLKIKNKNFSIISNNCWGGGIYEDLNIPYQTPTVGLYFFAPCYIKFLTKLDYYLNYDLCFITNSKYNEANLDRIKRKKNYPIGKLDDIEIHFLHYNSEDEALKKWERRKKRINFENLFVKFCDRDLCTVNEINEFENLDFKNKVLFSAKKNNSIKSLVFLKDYKNKPYVGSLYEEKWSYRKEFNVSKWINNKK